MGNCYFLGSGLHTHLGTTTAAQLQALARAPTPPQMASALYAGRQQTLPYKLLGDMPLTDPRTRLHRVLDAVIDAALQASGLTAEERANAGFFIGTSSFDISVSEAEYRDALQHDAAAIALASCSSQGVLAHTLRQRHGIHGPDFSFNTACTASANALLYADAMIRSGELRHALVVSSEVFNSLTALGFAGLQLLTKSTMKPFDRERNGLFLGEGCGALVLGAEKKSASAWQLLGSANLCDTHSMSAANPDGSTIAAVMHDALHDAGVQPEDISAIKTHGTASLSNDEAEAAGMLRVFNNNMPALTALKPFIGHTLGACGLNELLLFCGAAAQGWLPATPGIGADASALGVTLTQQRRELKPGHFMLNYFGFGGNNTSLILSNAAA